MKRIIPVIIIAVLTACSPEEKLTRDSLSLAGEWQFMIDSLDQGIPGLWFNKELNQKIKLPGSMTENGLGNEVDLKTPWTGDIVDQSYFTDSKYEKYRQPGNIKIPFWLKPVKYYKGAAWYSRMVDIPENWSGKRISLFLERPHWGSEVWVNGVEAGSANSLAVPHVFNITELLKPGNNRISIRIDNRMIIPVGVNSHSVSDHTQSDWNGIVGDISLRATSPLYISHIDIYPDMARKMVRSVVRIRNTTGKAVDATLYLQVGKDDGNSASGMKKIKVKVNSSSEIIIIPVDYPMGKNCSLWSEFTPELYKMNATLIDNKNGASDKSSATFGMREFGISGTRFTVNGLQVFLRGTLECCIFPLTGYPPVDVESWTKVLTTMKNYGLNTVRFHSWCPPEGAFTAADRLGMYFQIECSSWANQGTSVGDGLPVDRFIYDEGDRIMEAYGNHPSFCMLTYGNEPGGDNQNEYLGNLLNYWKAKDNRRVYTSGSGWPVIPENDFNLTSEPRIQHWGEGLASIINSKPPQTMYDFHDYVSQFKVPVVGHEIGQWCAYPDFSEIVKYTGVLKPTNFEIFRETLNENNMGELADKFLNASGKLQALCYKADIEAALRTPGFAGFHLLQLHDFPGQGTALVGVLNAFFESKGYISPEEFRSFCSTTVPLARMPKQVFTSAEKFSASVEFAHFGQSPLLNKQIICSVNDEKGTTLLTKVFEMDTIPVGNCNVAGSVEFDLSKIIEPSKLAFKVEIAGSDIHNSWDFWVYPANQDADRGDVYITDKLDYDAVNVLSRGGKVLLLTYGKVSEKKGARVAVGFSSIFWNTAWTNNQAPHTLGILVDPANPLFREFPTENYSNWQWWDPVTHSQAMILNGFPEGLKPSVRLIDTWFENRNLALAFEAKTAGGKIMVCSIDLNNKDKERIASKQLLKSILGYMNSNSFNPETEVSQGMIGSLIEK